MKKMLAIMLILISANIAINVSTNKDFDNRLTALEMKSSPPVTAMVTTTMYNPVVSQCDKDPLVTAANYKINPVKASEHKYVALSRNLLKRWGGNFNYGDKVQISGAGNKDGIYIVADTMNKRYSNHVDILETSGTDWYKYNDVSLTKLNG
jgi:3D (Asp-Asp-Asp) domain-containing protein